MNVNVGDEVRVYHKSNQAGMAWWNQHSKEFEVSDIGLSEMASSKNFITRKVEVVYQDGAVKLQNSLDIWKIAKHKDGYWTTVKGQERRNFC